MKTTIAMIGLCLVCYGQVSAQTNQTATNISSANVMPKKITKIITTDGDVYDGVKIEKVDPSGLTISYKMQGDGMGISHLSFDVLPDWIQQKYHYDPKTAADFKNAQAQGNAQLIAQMLADEKIKEQADRAREETDALARRQMELDNAAQELEKQRIEIQKKQAEAALAQAQNPNQPAVNINQQQQQKQ